MIGFALFGAGRIGSMHAGYIADHPQAELRYVYDVYHPAAEDVANRYGAKTAGTVEQILADDQVDAVLIATSTDTHVDLLIKAAKAGKAILCEKPIDLDTSIVERCQQEIKGCDVPIQIGFNRRFDPGHGALQAAVKEGEAGQLEQLIITSRDPGLAPVEYLKVSGGLFRDMAIHDFDMARFILNGDEPAEIQVIGSALIDDQVAELGDVDSAMIQMKTVSGRLVHINCSRRAVYGYDQRVEALGSAGMLQSDNPRPDGLLKTSATGTETRRPLYEFFIDRYQDAYRNQMNAFIAALVEGAPVSPSFEDGYKAQKLADAAQQSLDTGLPVKLEL